MTTYHLEDISMIYLIRRLSFALPYLLRCWQEKCDLIIIVDEAGINRIEHILWPFSLGIDPMASYKWRTDSRGGNTQNNQINDLLDLIVRSGAVATVIGDPKQSRPISPDRRDYSPSYLFI